MTRLLFLLLYRLRFQSLYYCYLYDNRWKKTFHFAPYVRFNHKHQCYWIYPFHWNPHCSLLHFLPYLTIKRKEKFFLCFLLPSLSYLWINWLLLQNLKEKVSFTSFNSKHSLLNFLNYSHLFNLRFLFLIKYYSKGH